MCFGRKRYSLAPPPVHPDFCSDPDAGCCPGGFARVDQLPGGEKSPGAGSSQAEVQVIFTGYLQGEELAAVYASSDVFVFPSTTETFGNVVLEAMAAGLPVAAAAAGSVKNLVVDGYNGFACRPRNAADLAAASLKLAADLPLRQKMARQARQYACERSWESLLPALLDSYREIAGLAGKLKRAG